jgi:cytochrome d ubiquinol oxidase subunit I
MVFSTLFAYLLLYAGLLSAYIWVVFYLARQADEKDVQAHPVPKSADSSLSPFGA